MKIVVPAKACSRRVPDKNYRPFWGGRSLVDIALSKACRVADPGDVYLSCEDESKRAVAEAHGANFIPRDRRLCDNDTPFYEVFNTLYDQVGGAGDLAWLQVTDPMFDGHRAAIDAWREAPPGHDSLAVVYPLKKYLLDPAGVPLGFGFGAGHVKSQSLPTYFDLTFTFSILRGEAVRKCGYYVGENPLWFHASNSHVDIDTQEEFELAARLYGLAAA